MLPTWQGVGNAMGQMGSAIGNKIGQMGNAIGNRFAPQGNSNDEMFGQWLKGQMPGQIPQAQVKDQMQQSLMRIRQLLGQGEQRIRDSINKMAQQNNFNTSNTSYARNQTGGMQQQMSHNFPEGDVLFELANFFDRWDEDCCNELANCAYYTHNLLCELDASMAGVPVQPQQQVVAAPANVQGANVPQAAAQQPQQAAPQSDDLKNLFGNIMQSVTNEFKQLLQYLQQAGVLS